MEMSWGLFTPQERINQETRRKTISKADYETTLAEKELEEWRKRSSPTERFCDIETKIELLKERFQARTPNFQPAVSPVPASMILTSEHESALAHLQDQHSLALEELRMKLQEEMNSKLESFEKALNNTHKEQLAYYEQKLSEADTAERKARDLSIAVEKGKINEEILLKSYEALRKQHELIVKDLNESRSRLHQELTHTKEQVSSKQSHRELIQETDRANSDIDTLKGQLAVQKSELESQSETIQLLKTQLANAESQLIRLEESESRLKPDAARYREAEFQTRSLTISLEEERKRRGLIETDYMKITGVIGKLRQELRTEFEQQFTAELDRLRADNNRIRTDYEAKNQMRKDDTVEQELRARNELLERQITHLERGKVDPGVVDALRQEVHMWKEKTVALVSKYYSVLKTLKKEHEKLKSSTVSSLDQIKTDCEGLITAGIGGTKKGKKSKHVKTS